MKFSFPVQCSCGENFPVHVTGSQLPKSAKYPKCSASIWLIEPLGNVVGMAMLSRANAELESQDWTLAILLAAMAVECELVYLFMKWNRIDLMPVKATDADDEAWEEEWPRTIAKRLEKVSQLLTSQSFDSFLSQNSALFKLGSQAPLTPNGYPCLSTKCKRLWLSKKQPKE
jgi:hypothetical protein